MLSNGEVVQLAFQEYARLIYTPNLLSCLPFRSAALDCNSISYLVRNTCSGGASPKHENSEVANFELGHLSGGVDGSEGHSTGALYIIIEASDLRCVLVQYPPSIGQAEIFKVDVRLRILLAASLYEPINEGIVFFPSYSWPAKAQI